MKLDNIVIKIIPHKKGKIVALSSIHVGDANEDGFDLKGFRILRGMYPESGYSDKDGTPLWVSAPSYLDDIGKHHPIFFTAAPQWKKLTAMILEEYMKIVS